MNAAVTRTLTRSLPLVALGVIYAILSVAFLSTQVVPWIKKDVEAFWSGLFIFGPPVALIYGLEFFWFFVLSSVAFWGFIGGSMFSKNPSRKLLLRVCAAVIWCLSGFISIGIMV